MGDGFTTESYVDLLDAAEEADYEFLTVAEYLSTDPDDRPDRYLIVRHDVDRKVANARRMARIEADRGVSTTYYVRTSTFDPGLVRSLESLGHEVGYHYEDLVRADGDVTEAHERFARNLGMFRRYCNVQTICMHGNPLSPHDNRDMWGGDAANFGAYDLLGEAYLSMDFVDVTYFSDTGRTWRDGALKIKDYTVGDSEKTVSADTTAELAALLRAGAFDRGCLLVHPERWADSMPELLVERTKDHAINTVKRGLRLVRPHTPSTTT